MRLHISAAVKHWSLYSPNLIAISAEEDISYRQLDAAGEEIARSLKEMDGSAPRVLVAVRDKSLLAAAIIACSRSGKVFTLVNPERVDFYLSAIEGIDGFNTIVSDSPQDSPVGYKRILLSRDVFKSLDVGAEQFDVDPFAEAAIIFTSGTSGTPKGVVRNNFSLLSEAILWIVELRLTRGVRFLIGRPFFYTGGFVFMYSALFVGGTIVTMNDDNENAMYYRAIMNPVNLAFLVPHQMHSLLHQNLSGAKKFADTVLCMGAPISAELKCAFVDRFSCSVIESWGNSEGIGTITEAEDLAKRPSSIGRPCFCDTVLVADKNGCKLSSGRVGYLVGMSDNQYEYYLHQSPQGKENGDLRLIFSEDYGYQDNDGFFYILGRECEKIEVEGAIVFPPLIEKIALGNSMVSDCVAVKVRVGKHEEELALAITGGACVDSGVIREWVNARLKKPPFISYVVPLKSIPRNAGGKIDREAAERMVKEAL